MEAAVKPLYTRCLKCACGKVRIELEGAPLMANVCHCNYCQKGSFQIEQLPHAPHILDRYKGTAYVLFRKDRAKINQGIEHCADYRLEGESKTRRIVASCCNSPLFLDFEPGHWVSFYQQRFETPVPQAEMRIQTGCLPAGELPDDGLPTFAGYPPAMMLKLLASRVAMGLRPNMDMR
jgi:hypothetical protein